MTDLLYLRDAYLREFDASVVDVDDAAVVLDRTAFYPTGGGQPHDTGSLAGASVVDVRKDGDRRAATRSPARCPTSGPPCTVRSTGNAVTS